MALTRAMFLDSIGKAIKDTRYSDLHPKQIFGINDAVNIWKTFAKNKSSTAPIEHYHLAKERVEG